MKEWLNKKQMQRAFNAAAKHYDHAADLQREVGDFLLDHIYPLETNNKTIIDIGSGTGYLSHKLALENIISIDIAEKMLQQSKQKKSIQACICTDIENLSLIDNSADVVISNMALQWCQDINHAFKEINRSLKPGGKLLFTLPIEPSLHELTSAWHSVDKYTHTNQFPKKQSMQETLQPLFRKTKLTTLRIIKEFDSIYALMKSLKSIGAHNVTTEKSNSLMGKEKLKTLENNYLKLKNNKLPLTYEILIGICEK